MVGVGAPLTHLHLNCWQLASLLKPKGKMPMLKKHRLTIVAATFVAAIVALFFFCEYKMGQIARDPRSLDMPNQVTLQDKTWSSSDRISLWAVHDGKVYKSFGASRDGKTVEIDLLNGVALLKANIAAPSAIGDIVFDVVNYDGQSVYKLHYNAAAENGVGLGVWTINKSNGDVLAVAFSTGGDTIAFWGFDLKMLAALTRDPVTKQWSVEIRERASDIPDALYTLIAGYKMSRELLKP